MAVRNFWISADIDGRKTELSGGPRAKSGAMSLKLKIRDRGTILDALEIECYAPNSGQLIISVRPTRELRELAKDPASGVEFDAGNRMYTADDGRMVIRTRRDGPVTR